MTNSNIRGLIMAAPIKVIIFVLAAVAMASCQRIMDAPRDVDLYLPWIPQWVECDFDYETFKNGPSCNDCYSILHCTPKGGVLRTCFGWTPYCVEGHCAEEPSVDCADVETVTDVY